MTDTFKPGDRHATAALVRQDAAARLDEEAVDRFAVAMKVKLATKREQGREGWQTCPPEVLSQMLREHVEKGDPVDVANFAMMLHQTGERITPAERGDRG